MRLNGDAVADGAPTLHFHGALSGLVRDAEFQGRGHLVAPVVLVREMVLSDGPNVPGELLPAEEIVASVDRSLWEGRPITIGHPKVNGQYVSAGTLAAAEATQVGALRNLRADTSSGTTRLVGEAWVDVAAAQRVALGAEVLAVMEQFKSAEVPPGATPLEVSTGYWADLVALSGVFAGKAYNGVEKNIVPDHLALLPGGVGKCSLADGCGMPRLNAAGDVIGESDPEPDPVPESFAIRALRFVGRALGLSFENSPSDGDVRDALRSQLEAAYGGPNVMIWIADVYSADGQVVFEQETADGAAGYYRVGFAVDPTGAVSLVGTPVEVTKVTTYEPVANEGGAEDEEETDNAEPEDRSMKELNAGHRVAIVAALVACAACSYEEATLNALSDEDLATIAQRRGVEIEGLDFNAFLAPEATGDAPTGGETAGTGAASAATGDAGTGGDAPAAPAGDAPTGNERRAVPLADLPPEVVAIVNERSAARKARIDALVANERCNLTRETLEAIGEDGLAQLEATFAERTFRGRGGVGGRTNEAGEKSYIDEHPTTPSVFTRKVERSAS